MRLKTYKMAMSILPKFLTLKWNISRSIWSIEVGAGSGFFFHFSRSFIWLNFFRAEYPFNYLLWSIAHCVYTHQGCPYDQYTLYNYSLYGTWKLSIINGQVAGQYCFVAANFVLTTNISVNSKPDYPLGDPRGSACSHCPRGRVFAQLSLPGGSEF